jgi:hypothetical protein
MTPLAAVMAGEGGTRPLGATAARVPRVALLMLCKLKFVCFLIEKDEHENLMEVYSILQRI